MSINNQEKYELTITADNVISTDSRFSMSDLTKGDYYKQLDACFIKSNGEVIRRKYNKGERRNSNQTLPRIAFQLFEKQIASLSVEEKEQFPVCRYKTDSELLCGVFTSEEEFKKYRNTREHMTYYYGDGRKLVIYCWNIFSTIVFVQECLKRFGEKGDRFILTYRDKDEKENKPNSIENTNADDGCRNPYSQILLESKNIILRGAPGTGKSYLAKEIAADIVSNGYFDKYESLSAEQKRRVAFVQFHPSYDYSDFVEGLRPRLNDDGSMGFECKDGVFKAFVDNARENYEGSHKSKDEVEKEELIQDSINAFLENIKCYEYSYSIVSGRRFCVTRYNEQYIHINIDPNGKLSISDLRLKIADLKAMLASGISFKKSKDITAFKGIKETQQEFSYYLSLYKEILKKKKQIAKPITKVPDLKKYVFIIDEINRGEISKIFGELFFSIDPGYRGLAGEVSTKYANMHDDPEKKFYVPDNVYIIGTMNDIDRSVDTFDFAMRRRFRFIELKADDRVEMLDDLDDDALKDEAIVRMSNLNKAIAETEDLNENYQIGASYFLKLKKLTFDQLWTDYLEPLLLDYVQGMYEEKAIMSRFKAAYNNTNADTGDDNENQG